MYLAVSNVQAQDDYLLLLTFENGEKRQFDMKPYLSIGIFNELKDIKLFKTVHKNFDTVVWENEADLDPEILYRDSVKIE